MVEARLPIESGEGQQERGKGEVLGMDVSPDCIHVDVALTRLSHQPPLVTDGRYIAASCVTIPAPAGISSNSLSVKRTNPTRLPEPCGTGTRIGTRRRPQGTRIGTRRRPEPGFLNATAGCF